MRRLPLPDPLLGEVAAADAIETIIVPRLRDIGAFTVRCPRNSGRWSGRSSFWITSGREK
jgi:hypothetical protein